MAEVVNGPISLYIFYILHEVVLTLSRLWIVTNVHYTPKVITKIMQIDEC